MEGQITVALLLAVSPAELALSPATWLKPTSPGALSWWTAHWCHHKTLIMNFETRVVLLGLAERITISPISSLT